MLYYSTKNQNIHASFREAVLNGIAPDGGLYMPIELPVQRSSYIDSLQNLSFQEISFDIAKIFVDHISDNDLHTIIERTITFDAPLVRLSDNLSVLELFHGPTLAFKDFGARFLSNTLSVLTREEDKTIVILVATSGDTGSAVAHGFYDNERIKVALLYPSGKVSQIQEQQLTTVGKNIQAFEIKGTFDDCQRLVKTAFLDNHLKRDYLLSSANSINIARLIPQTFYYFHAYAQSLKRYKESIIFSVPCGNFGNLTAGIIAHKLGLPVKKFIASVNENNVFEQYVKTGIYRPKDAVKTLANAMDVGNPSNFERIMALFNRDRDELRKTIDSYRISDEQIKEGIRDVYQKFDYLIDPHGAVGYQALKEIKNRSRNKNHAIILETAHPAKFLDIVSPIINRNIEIPARLDECLHKEKNSILVSENYSDFEYELRRWLA